MRAVDAGRGIIAISLALGLAMPVTGCGEEGSRRDGGADQSRSTNRVQPKDPAMERLLSKRLRAAERLRKREVAENRQLLGEIQTYPGGKSVHEASTPVGTRALSSDEELRFDAYAANRLPADEYRRLTATGWATSRSYVLPRGVRLAAIHDFFTKQLSRRWKRGRTERGPRSLTLNFFRASHCVTVVIGIPVAIKGAFYRGLDLNVARLPRTSC
jgi:hypothetical protein